MNPLNSSDDATYISALTLDSSFPRAMRKKEQSRVKSSVMANSSRRAASPKKPMDPKKEAHKQLSRKIKELQEKVRLAKMIEEVYEESMSEIFNQEDLLADESHNTRQTVTSETTNTSFDPDRFRHDEFNAPPIFEERSSLAEDDNVSVRSGSSSVQESLHSIDRCMRNSRRNNAGSRSPRRNRRTTSSPMKESVAPTVSSEDDELLVGFPSKDQGQ